MDPGCPKSARLWIARWSAYSRYGGGASVQQWCEHIFIHFHCSSIRAIAWLVLGRLSRGLTKGQGWINQVTKVLKSHSSCSMDFFLFGFGAACLSPMERLKQLWSQAAAEAWWDTFCWMTKKPKKPKKPKKHFLLNSSTVVVFLALLEEWNVTTRLQDYKRGRGRKKMKKSTWIHWSTPRFL